MKLVSLVIPVYHEEESLPFFFDAINPIIDSLKGKYSFELVFATDYPDSGTYSLLLDRQKRQSNIVVIRLSRSFGHEEAIAAGLKVAKGDCVIPLDADLQDDPNAIPLMLEKWEEGFDVVNGKRSNREEKFVSRMIIKYFYFLFHRWSKKINVPKNVGDFRLIDRRVVDEINRFGSSYRVLKIDVPYAGFKITEVEYVRTNRIGGKSHYGLFSLFRNAFDYYTVISDGLLFAIFIVAAISFSVALLSFLALIIVGIIDACTSSFNLGWLAYVIWFAISLFVALFGIGEFSLYIVGGYSNRAFVESNKRPPYIIESITYSDNKEEE